MSRINHFHSARSHYWRLSLFEKVILTNSLMLVGEALAGLWVTSHNVEAQHYLIDTSFLVLATLMSLFINIMLLRASFRPLFSLHRTIREVSIGKTEARCAITSSDAQIGELALAFNTMLDRLEEVRREQAILILQAQEQERRRIALELHDETGQNLTALLVHTEVINRGLNSLTETAITNEARKNLDSGLKQLTLLTQSTLENIRTISQQLRPSVLDDLGLAAAFRWLVEDGRQRLHLSIDLSIDMIEDTTRSHHQPALYETTLFRIAQESLTNTPKHTQHKKVSLSLIQDKHHICLKIQDDGCGFDPEIQRTGLGLFGMHERAKLIGGTLTIQSQVGKGTTIEAFIPLAASQMKEITYAS